MSTDLRSLKLTKAIQHAIDEARLAYAFRAGSYTMSALYAVLALEQVYPREADRRHDITPITNPEETP
jgi:hypothetical protein